MKRSLSILLLLLGLQLSAKSDTLTLQGSATGVTQIRSDNPGKNYGADFSLIIGRTTAPGILHGLLSFDLSSIPTGATITGISLTLVSSGTGATTNQSGSVALNLHSLLGDFVEGAGNAAGEDSTVSATWLRADSDTLWTRPGGDYSPSVLSTLNVDPTANPTGAVSIFSSSAGFISAAQSAFQANQPLSLLLKLNDTNEAENLRRAFFFVSDNGPEANAPKLVVEYTPVPEPGTAALGITGMLVLGLRRRRSAGI